MYYPLNGDRLGDRIPCARSEYNMKSYSAYIPRTTNRMVVVQTTSRPITATESPPKIMAPFTFGSLGIESEKAFPESTGNWSAKSSSGNTALPNEFHQVICGMVNSDNSTNECPTVHGRYRDSKCLLKVDLNGLFIEEIDFQMKRHAFFDPIQQQMLSKYF